MFRRHELYFRIATTEAGLQRGNLFVRHIPPPSLVLYQDFSERVDTADFGQALRGIPYVEILWDQIRKDPAFIINEMIETVLAAGTPLWLTIDLGANRSYQRGRWADIYGTPVVPQQDPDGGSRGLLISNFRLRVNNVVIDNNPATGL